MYPFSQGTIMYPFSQGTILEQIYESHYQDLVSRLTQIIIKGIIFIKANINMSIN